MKMITRLTAPAFLVPLAALVMVSPLRAQTPEPSPTPAPQPSAPAEPPPAPDKRAEALLALMVQTYADLQSYSDSSTAIYHNRDGSERLRVEFKTWYVRPNEFRIDASSRTPSSKVPRREVMWTNGTAARAWASDRAVKSTEKVKIIASGMFGTYAYHVPTLLDESYGGAQRLNNITSPTFVGEEVVDGISCYRIKGTWVGDPYEIWLGTVDNMVRKITAKYQDHQLEELHRDIAVNQDIPTEVFRFAPEQEKLPPPATAAPTKKKSSPAPAPNRPFEKPAKRKVKQDQSGS